jgi:hypothetical protein
MQTEKEYLTSREIISLRSDSVGEYSLPDYNGDVKKILAVKTKVYPTGKFVGDETLEFSGSVGYEIVYIDGENNITHTEFTTDYDAAVKINAESYVDSDVKTCVSGCNVRLVGPRKLSVKASLDSDIVIGERKIYEIDGDAFSEYEPETLSSYADIIEVAFAVGEPREINEELISIEGAIADEVELLISDARFLSDAVECDGESVTLKGKLTVSALVRNADEQPRTVTKEIAFSEAMTVSDPETFSSLDARCDISSFKTTVTPTDDGVSVSVALAITPSACLKKNNRLKLITDSYLKERGCENEYSEFGYTEHLCTESKEELFEVKRNLSELGIEVFGDIIYAEAQPRVEKSEINKNTVEIEGELRFSAIACQVLEGGEQQYYPIRFSVPFTQNVNINCQIHENMRANCAVNADDVKITFDENNAFASANLTFFVTLSVDKRQRCLGSSYLTDEEFSRDESVVTVYYPDASESLFAIAKKFHTSVRDIAAANKLSESVFASANHSLGGLGVEKILIK